VSVVAGAAQRCLEELRRHFRLAGRSYTDGLWPLNEKRLITLHFEGYVTTAVQDVTHATTSRTSSSPKRSAEKGGAMAASAPVSNLAEWPTPREAYTPPASHDTVTGAAEEPGTSVEPISIPDTQPEARADDTLASSDNISQFLSPPADFSKDLIISDDNETLEDNDAVTQAPNPSKNRHLSSSSSSETEVVKYSKEDFLKTHERHRSRSATKPSRRRRHRKN
jgi:hypothetical protein